MRYKKGLWSKLINRNYTSPGREWWQFIADPHPRIGPCLREGTQQHPWQDWSLPTWGYTAGPLTGLVPAHVRVHSSTSDRTGPWSREGSQQHQWQDWSLPTWGFTAAPVAGLVPAHVRVHSRTSDRTGPCPREGPQLDQWQGLCMHELIK